MAALTAPRNTPEYGNGSVIDLFGVPVEASVRLWPGSMIAIDANGYAIPATPGGSNIPIIILGRSEIDADNTGNGQSVFSGTGAAGTVRSQSKRGVYAYGNSSGVDLIGIGNVGQIAYAADDQTLALTPGLNGARLPVGLLVPGPTGFCVDASGVWIEINGQNVPPASPVGGRGGEDLVLPAAGALTSGTIVSVNASGQVAAATAGAAALGILINSPAGANASAIVRLIGFHPAINAGGTIAVGGLFESNATGKAVAITVTSAGTGILTAGQILGVATTAGTNGNPFAGIVLPRGIPAITPA